ncbi:cellular communication network factor 4b [Latimeria chalumnae]|uniref:CCN family member 3 n=2 Tax=Latimeria chalumnae TaxID=7897 RepID=H3AKX4_LATCH|nr:PREDICTED: WNT1-inducible-signaling pathway protein 1 isoform X2 [Latimeria chalumnae]|eukprot:XP_006005325.1 PREDICTED: WNT1-inducible-signaling pathway protein 1 isoform X2 [Latimeria chalumnae]
MRLLPWILTAISIFQVSSRNTTTMVPVSNVTEYYNRVQYCKWPCKCPKAVPRCPPGVSLITDGCDCCKACAKQLGETCNEADSCDFHRGLYCDYSADRPRYEKGVCAYMTGVGCELNGIIYPNGKSFQPNCKYKCTCFDGVIGCIPVCKDFRPPLVWCQNPKRVKLAGRCCEQWICDDSRRIRKTSPRHISSSAYGMENESWHKNCVIQSSPWSTCSRTCGLGISLRISNDNDNCRLLKERRLCNLRPCEVDITKHIRPGKKCLAVYRQEEPTNYTISGCVSNKPYRPKYCGVCTDDRCCTPYKSKTIDVTFQCPDGTGFSWKVMRINACFCNLGCGNPNDIFTDLAYYHDFSEIGN